MQIKRIIPLIVIALVLNSCIRTIDGSGEVIQEQREVEPFSKIDISGSFEILLNQGDKERLELEVDGNLTQYITTEVYHNTLYISSTEKIGKASSLKLYITVIDVEKIDLSGSISLDNKGRYTTENLKIEVHGASDINLDVEIENLTLDLNGASETTLKGKATNLKVKISGAGELQAKKLKTRNTKIDISGAASAIVDAKKTLKVSISGAGSVKYKGNPKIDQDISGAGSLEQL